MSVSVLDPGFSDKGQICNLCHFFVFFSFFETGILYTALSWNPLWRPGWTLSHRDPPASASQLWLKVCTATPGLSLLSVAPL